MRAVAGRVAVLAALWTGGSSPRVAARRPSTARLTAATLSHGIDEALDWFTRNQRPDGSWLFQYDAAAGRDLGGYDVVHHAGAVSALWQAAGAGFDAARGPAAAGVDLRQPAPPRRGRLVGHLQRHRARWRPGRRRCTSPGSACAVQVTGDHDLDDEMHRLAALPAWPRPRHRGSVLAYREPGRRAVRRRVLAVRHRPGVLGAGADAPAVPGRGLGRAGAADRHLPGVAARRPGGRHARRLRPLGRLRAVDGGGVARRRSGPPAARRARCRCWSARPACSACRSGGRASAPTAGSTPLLRGGHAIPAGLGSLGEGIAGLWRVAEADPRLTSLADALGDRATCAAGMVASRQVTAAQAAAYPEPGRVQGAWFHGGLTRMDDEQHTLSAMVRSLPIAEQARPGRPGATTDLPAVLGDPRPPRPWPTRPAPPSASRPPDALAASASPSPPSAAASPRRRWSCWPPSPSRCSTPCTSARRRCASPSRWWWSSPP